MTPSLPLPKKVREVVLPFSACTVTETTPLKIAIFYTGNHTLGESSSCPQTSCVLGACPTSTFLRHCPQPKTYEIANCTRKHPSILHTWPRQASTTDVGVGTDDDIGAQVRCSMANTDENIASRSFERFRTGMAVIPVKARAKGSDKSVITYAFLDNGSNSSFCNIL